MNFEQNYRVVVFMADVTLLGCRSKFQIITINAIVPFYTQTNLQLNLPSPGAPGCSSAASVRHLLAISRLNHSFQTVAVRSSAKEI